MIEEVPGKIHFQHRKYNFETILRTLKNFQLNYKQVIL